MNKVYIVQEEDTFDKIANLFGVGIEELIHLNHLEYNLKLEPGMRLLIPVNKQQPFLLYSVKEGDTLFSIAQKYAIDVDTLSAINGLKLNEYIYENQEIIIPKPGVITYLTKNGDTLRSVAKLLNTSVGEIFLDNNNIYLLPEQLLIAIKREK